MQAKFRNDALKAAVAALSIDPDAELEALADLYWRVTREMTETNERLYATPDEREASTLQEREDELSRQRADIENRVFAIPAHGPRGLLAKIRLAYATGELEKFERTPVEIEQRLIQVLLRDLRAMAG